MYRASDVFWPNFQGWVIDPDFDGEPPALAPLTAAELEGYAFGCSLLPADSGEPEPETDPVSLKVRTSPRKFVGTVTDHPWVKLWKERHPTS